MTMLRRRAPHNVNPTLYQMQAACTAWVFARAEELAGMLHAPCGRTVLSQSALSWRFYPSSNQVWLWQAWRLTFSWGACLGPEDLPGVAGHEARAQRSFANLVEHCQRYRSYVACVLLSPPSVSNKSGSPRVFAALTVSGSLDTEQSTPPDATRRRYG